MKKIIVSIIVLCLILSSISIVNASTGTVNLITKSKSVKPGETFTVTLSVLCEDGINGVDTKYNYDHNKLELVSANVANNNWSNLGTDNSITVISNSSSKITSSDVYVLTFKVKDNATGTTKVETSDIMIDSDLAENSSFNVKAKSIDITIITDSGSEDNKPEDNKPEDNKPEDNKPEDNKPEDNKPEDNKPEDNKPEDNKPEDNKPEDNKPEDNKPEDNKPEDNKPEDNKPEDNNQGSNTNGNTDKNDNTTVTDTKLPKTGDVNFVLVASMGIGVVSAIGFFVKAKSIIVK